MKNKLILFIANYCLLNSVNAQNCEINVSVNPTTITCGQSAILTAYGSSTGQVVLDEDFNSGGFGPGWSSTPGSTNFTNPCSPSGVDGTTHAWMDDNTSVPRTLTSAPYDLSAATAGVSVCFDLLFATQGDPAPCEGPDEPDEGVYLQYSIDGGLTWVDIHYFDPNGGNDPQLTNWNNWCFALPTAAITSNTLIRWHQTADSGADYDHWGIDNVQIFQNDVNAEVEWLHDGYSYGVGNPGGENPNPVSPIVTTTYTAQITTGTGDVCTADVTLNVIDPVYEVNVAADSTSLCIGNCTAISGTAQQVVDPGGIETYENNEFAAIFGTPAVPIFNPVGTINAAMNINITTLNSPTVLNDQIMSICINGLAVTSGFGCSTTSLADVSLVLACPSGTEIILADIGQLSGNTLSNMCFSTGGSPISSGSSPYTGSFAPFEPINDLSGCTSNGIWTLKVVGENYETCVPVGGITGWNITFDDPPIYAPTTVSWSPTNGLSDPNSINTTACPTNTTDYILTVSNGTPGCATYMDTVPITVTPCNGCVPPNVIINPISACAPATVDLTTAIDPSSEVATTTFYATQNDAQNNTNPISSSVNTSGTYWMRYENPSDPTCFGVQPIIVTISSNGDASFTLTDFCQGEANAASNIATAGGTFTFNPVPTNGETINATTGEISGGIPGNNYTVEYTISGGCPANHSENVTINPNPTPTISGTLSYCTGGSATLNAGGPYASYSWSIGGNNQTINTTAQTGITVTVTDMNGCIGTSSPVTVVESNEIIYNDQIEICEGQSTLIHGVAQSVAGVYSTTVSLSSSCDSTANITLVVNPSPTAGITATPSSGSDPLDVVLTNESINASSYFWDFGNGGILATNNLDNQNQIYTGGDSFIVILIAQEGQCTDTAYATIELNGSMVIEIPNVFTPNGDLANDLFFFNSKNVASLEITIFNRWGQAIYTSDNVNFMWDGRTTSGSEASEGVYFYKYTATSHKGINQDGHGFIHLER